MKKASWFCTLLFVIAASVMMPFSVSANQSLPAPFWGVNVKMIGRDVERYATSESISISMSNMNFNCQSVSSGACLVYSPVSPNSSITGTISVTNGTTNYYLYEYEFILDGNYIGTVTLDTFGMIYVSGDRFTVTDTSSTININITNYNLSANNDFQRWDYPIESFPWASYMLNSLGKRYYGINRVNNYMFPIFNLQNNDVIYTTTAAKAWTYDLIFYANRSVNNAANMSNFIQLSNGSFKNYQMINRFSLNGRLGYLCKVQIGDFTFSNANQEITLTWIGGNDSLFMPIYMNPEYDASFISTDFALNFGLSNRLLDSLEYLVQGTPAAAESESQLDDQTSAANDSFDQAVSIENDFSEDMNSALDDIDTSFSPSNMGSKFQSSAIWVTQQFDRVTSSTPFGSLLGFSLLLGLALLIVGKVL